MLELGKRQRSTITDQAVHLKSGKPLPPEARVSNFDNNGSVKLDFTSSLNIPDGATDEVKNEREANRRRLEEGLPPKKQKVEVFAVKQDGFDADDDQ